MFLNHDEENDEEPNDIIIPEVVERELDELAKNPDRPSSVRYTARVAKRFLSDLRLQTGERLYSPEGIELPNGARIHGLKHDEQAYNSFARTLYNPHNDQRILWSMINFLDANVANNPSFLESFRFVSADKDFRDQVHETTIRGLPVRVEDFHYEQIKDPHQRYTGKIVVASPGSAQTTVPSKKSLGLEGRLKPNQVVVVSHKDSEEPTYFVNVKSGRLRSLTHYEEMISLLDEQPWTTTNNLSYDFANKDHHEELRQRILDSNLSSKVKKELRNREFVSEGQMKNYVNMLAKKTKSRSTMPKNSVLALPFNNSLRPIGEQKPLVDLLADDSVSVMSVEASQGGGKTLFSTMIGLLKTYQGVYNGVTYIRSTDVIGQDIGFLPGTEEQKVSRFMRPVREALEEIFGYHDMDIEEQKNVFNQIEHLAQNNYLKQETITTISGRTMRNRFMIVDEAHLYTRAQTKMLLGRAGRGTKTIFMGDLDQIAAFQNGANTPRFLNERTSGLAHIPVRLVGESEYAHIRLPSDFSERGPGARLARKLG